MANYYQRTRRNKSITDTFYLNNSSRKSSNGSDDLQTGKMYVLKCFVKLYLSANMFKLLSSPRKVNIAHITKRLWLYVPGRTESKSTSCVSVIMHVSKGHIFVFRPLEKQKWYADFLVSILINRLENKKLACPFNIQGKSDLRQIFFSIFQIKRLAMTPTLFETFSGLGIETRLPLRLFFPYI